MRVSEYWEHSQVFWPYNMCHTTQGSRPWTCFCLPPLKTLLQACNFNSAFQQNQVSTAEKLYLQSGKHCIYHSGCSEQEPILTTFSLQVLANTAALQRVSWVAQQTPPCPRISSLSVFLNSVWMFLLPWFCYMRVINLQNLCPSQVNKHIPCFADSWAFPGNKLLNNKCS